MLMRYTKRVSDAPNRYASEGVANPGEVSNWPESVIVRRQSGYEMHDWARVLTIEQSLNLSSLFVTSGAGYVCVTALENWQ